MSSASFEMRDVLFQDGDLAIDDRWVNLSVAEAYQLSQALLRWVQEND